MKKILAAILACLMLCGGNAFAATADSEANPEDFAWAPAAEAVVTMDNIASAVPSAILMERDTGQILFEQNAHKRYAPASVTKIMTILLIVEAIESGTLSLKDTVTASSYAAGMGGSQIFLEEGEKMTVEELLKSVIVCSANDAAVALAEHIAGSESAFVKLMNDKAKELGMNDTVFSNCTGLPVSSEHLTTAYDIAVMSRELIRHSMIKKYTTIWMDTVRGGKFGISNTNKLVRFFNGATGLKTGFTDEAMFCLSATAERSGVEYIAVIMHAETSDIRFEAAKALLNYGFATYTVEKVLPDEALPPVAVELGEASHVQPEVYGNTGLLLKKKEATGLTKTVTLDKSVKAPVIKGQKIGTITVKSQKGDVIKELPLVAATAVNKLNWWQIFTKYVRVMATGRL